MTVRAEEWVGMGKRCKRSRGEGRKKGLWAPVRLKVDLVIYLVEGCEQNDHGDEPMVWLLLISCWNLRDFMFLHVEVLGALNKYWAVGN